jgi:hypothetical protein
LKDDKTNLVERLRKEVENHVRAGSFD